MIWVLVLADRDGVGKIAIPFWYTPFLFNILHWRIRYFFDTIGNDPISFLLGYSHRIPDSDPWLIALKQWCYMRAWLTQPFHAITVSMTNPALPCNHSEQTQFFHPPQQSPKERGVSGSSSLNGSPICRIFGKFYLWHYENLTFATTLIFFQTLKQVLPWPLRS